MLYPKIVEITTDKRSGETYVLVHFWRTAAERTAAGRPFLREDFVMRLRPDNDPRAQLRGNLRRYIAEAERLGYRGDNTSGNARSNEAFVALGREVRPAGKRVYVPRERDESDPHGVLARSDVTDMRDREIDVEAVSP